MLNFLPALIFLLVHGSGDPETLRVRDTSYRLLIVQAVSLSEPAVEVSFSAPDAGERPEESDLVAVDLGGETVWTADALARQGFGSSAIARDGPAR